MSPLRAFLSALVLLSGIVLGQGNLDVTIPLLPAGKEVQVVYSTTVNASPTGTAPDGSFSISQQATISATGQANTLTDGDGGTAGLQATTVSGLVPPLDFGDAPDAPGGPATGTPYPTLLEHNGASHVLTGPFLGASVDSEADGQPTSNATGDDTDGNDDEDGVVFTSLLTPGTNATVDVSTTGAGLLNAWIDFNDDGDWADPGEQIFTDLALAAGANAGLTFAVPAVAPTAQTFARFRFDQSGGLSYDGPASDGEVEDYEVAIEESSDISVDVIALSPQATPGDPVDFTITVTNNGPSDNAAVSLTSTFPAILTPSWSSVASGGASGNTAIGSGDLAESISMPSGSSVTYTVNALIDPDATGTVSVSASAAPTGTDPNLTNNSDTSSAVTLVPSANLAIGVTDSPDPVLAGNALVYTVEVTNNGPSTAQDVAVSTTLPAGATLVSTSGTAEDPAGVPTGTLGTIQPGDSALFTITVIVDRTTTGSISFGAEATTSTSDPSLVNNNGGAATTVQENNSIGDFVWNDLNGDGVQDAGEPGLAGVTVFLDLNTNGTLDGGEPSDTTDGAGVYTLTGLPSGTFQILADPSSIPIGFVSTTSNPLPVNLPVGGDITNADLGFQQQDATIGDFVWNDLNGDGVQDGGEPGISGVQVYIDLNDNGNFNGGEPSVVTDANGAYDFTGLPTGTYQVRPEVATLPAGFVQTGGAPVVTVNLAAGEDFNDADFGYQQQDAVIGDFVWNDLNGDGVQDAGEPGLSSLTVYIDSNENGVLDAGEPSAVTDAAGAYDFTDLATGTYLIRVDEATTPIGFVRTGGSVPTTVDLAAGEDFNDADFGYQQQDAVIGDFVWDDLNRDGVQDAGEPGIPGVMVFLDLNSNGTLDGGEPTEVTAGGGAYNFTGLATGTYSVRVDESTLPTDYTVLSANPVVVNLAAGEIFSDADFGAALNSADLAVAVEVLQSPLVAGGDAFETFRVTVTNNGPADATGVELTQTSVFPASVTPTSVVPSIGSFSGGVWSLDLPNGGNAVLTVTVQAEATAAAGPVDFAIGVTSLNQFDTDDGNDSASAAASIISAADTDTAITVAATVEFQSGLFVSEVTVTNNNAAAIPAFRLYVKNLPGDVQLYNAYGTRSFGTPPAELPYLLYNQSLRAGQAVVLRVEFFRPSLDPDFSPQYEIELLPVSETPPAAATEGIAVTRNIRLANGDHLIEIASIPGTTYAVEYSADMSTWIRVTPTIAAVANRLQWIDNGPPKTESHPSTAGSRFYRFVSLPAP